MAKKDILSRFNLKDYNKELEQILDKKDFPSQAKNLLLSMFYKLEIGYKDYIVVKKDSPSKEAFLESIMYIIKEKCNEIEIIKPSEDEIEEKRHYAIPEEGKIACYQNEASILHALLELGDKYFLMQNEEDIVKKSLQEMLKEGYELDIKETITNFDGWSWNNNFDKLDRIDYFVIYEILRIILGNNLLNEWKRSRRERDDYLKDVKKKLKDLYDNICKYCIMCELYNNQELKQELKRLKDELNKMKNKSEFLESKCKRQKELSRTIKEIDKILSNSSSLRKEFIERNRKLPVERRIFSISNLEELLQTERANCISEKEAVNRLLDPRSYVKKMERLQESINLAEGSGYQKASPQKMEEDLINVQRGFIEQLKKTINSTEDKKEIQELVNKFRYYLYLPIKVNNEVIEIKDVPQLKMELEKLEKKLITKACKRRALIIINEDIAYNAKIMNKILNTKLIDLNSITVNFVKQKESIEINIFDGEVLDRTETISKDKEKDFRIKFDRKIKLFN